MRVALPFFLEVITVITRGGNAVTIYRQHPLCDTLAVLRRLQANAPRLTVGLFTRSLKLTGYLNHITGHSQLSEALHKLVHRITGSNAVEVDLNINFFAQLLPVTTQMLHAHPRTCSDQLLSARHLFGACLGAKAPEIEQWLQCQVECTLTLLMQQAPGFNQLQHLVRHSLTSTRRGLVELLDGGIIAIGRHLSVNLSQDCIGLELE